MHGWVTQLLEEGREVGELAFEGPAEVEAWVLISALQGAHQHSRTLGVDVTAGVARTLGGRLLTGAG